MNSSGTKLRRRMFKYQNIIMKDYGLNLSKCPTKVVMICNGGLVNGVDQELVLQTFSQFGSIENIAMIPGKSYSFVLYKEVTSAEAALSKINNTNIWPIIKGPVYLAYTEKIPDSLNENINFYEKPTGLFVIENFISEEDETRILQCIGYPLPDVETKSSELKNRRVSHFGYEFKYSCNNVDVKEPIKSIPAELDFIWDKLLNLSPELGLTLNFRPDQLTVNNYQPGQGIPSHVDTHSAFEDPIVSLSLQSSVIMEFKNAKGKCCNVLLPARSLCIMSGESRYGWTHGIATRKSDVIPAADGGLTLQFRKERTSFTFRKIRQRDCSCSFPDFCDTYLERHGNSNVRDSVPVLKDVAAKLEENYVHEVYEKISDHFSETRHKPWPNVVKFIESLPTGSILVDVGCGNGKYFSVGSRRFELGLDASCSLTEVCRKRGFECFTGNCLRIPLRDNIADGCISIAVVHHLGTEERRKRAVGEMIRILRPNGRALIYVWAKNQMRWNEKSSYLKQNTRKRREIDVKEKSIVLDDVHTDLKLPVHTNRTNFVHNDLLVPWKLKEKNDGADSSMDPPVFLRYYHVFEDEELRDLCAGMNDVEVLDYYYDQGNWCILLKKRPVH